MAIIKKSTNSGVPIMTQQKQIRLVFMRLQVQSLALLSGLRICWCHELWYRSQTRSDLALLWLWCRPVATALIGPKVLEPIKVYKHYIVGRNVDWCNHYGKQYRDSAKKLKTEVLFDPAIPLLDLYPEKTGT